MTPAQLTTTMRAIFGEYKPSISSSELHQVLARVLGHEITCAQCGKPHPTWCCCPTCGPSSGGTIIVPDKPSAPLREPATMVAKDRAAETAETQGAWYAPRDGSALEDRAEKMLARIRTALHGYAIGPTGHREIIESVRAYGDELLEKACEKVAAHHPRSLERMLLEIKSLKGGIAS